MGAELTRQIRQLQHGDHSCLLYETRGEQQAAMIPFFVEGLARGERCLYIADDRTTEEVKGFLHEAGIDVSAQIARGALTLLTKRDTYLESGVFDPDAMVATLGNTLREALAAGFTGLRGSGEMTWALGHEPGCDRAIEYEARLNDFIPGKKFVAICQYNQARFAPGIILDVLRTHHFAVLGEQVCPNLYFEPSDMVLGQSNDAARLNWRLRQLRLARDAVQGLEQAIRAREAFFSMASHELRTPLTSLHLQLERGVREAERMDPSSSVADSLRRAINQAGQMNDLIDRLLDVTHLSRGGLELRLAAVDLASIVRAVIQDLEGTSTQAQCLVDLDVHPVVGQWDELRVRQVVANLLRNAFKYGAGKPVRVSVSARGEMAVLTVRDEGMGIEPKDQARIFGPFQRAVSDRNYSGFGVGLWIVQQVVEAHGGSIRLESAPGAGATFTVLLPLHAPREPAGGLPQA